MLFGLVGLTAIASSDSFNARWLTSTFTIGAAPAAPASTNARTTPAATTKRAPLIDASLRSTHVASLRSRNTTHAAAGAPARRHDAPTRHVCVRNEPDVPSRSSQHPST